MKLNVKIIGITFIVVLFLALFAYYIFSPDIMFLKTTDPKKLIQFENTRVTGWNKGKKSYELFAKFGWTTHGGNVTYFEDVWGGKVFDEGKIVARNIRALQVKAYKYSEVMEATAKKEDRSGALSLEVDFHKVGTKESEPRWVSISANKLKYDPSKKKTILTGNVVLKEKDISIYSKKADIDHEDKVAILSGNLALKRDDLEILGDYLKAETSPDRYIIEGNVSVLQPGKVALGENAVYLGEEEIITLSGKAQLILEKGKALLKEEGVKEMKSPEAKEALEEKTVLECNELELLTDPDDAIAKGDVLVTQKDKTAKADYAKYLDSEDKIILTGNVFMKRESDWIKTEKIIISIEDETFEAFGKVETEFKLKK